VRRSAVIARVVLMVVAVTATATLTMIVAMIVAMAVGVMLPSGALRARCMAVCLGIDPLRIGHIDFQGASLTMCGHSARA
jgi:hypothetical protein